MLNKWSMIAARLINKHSRSAVQSVGGSLRAANSSGKPDAEGDAETNGSRIRKVKSALQLFHQECGARDRALGLLRGNRVKKHSHAKVDCFGRLVV